MIIKTGILIYGFSFSLSFSSLTDKAAQTQLDIHIDAAMIDNMMLQMQ